MRGLDISNWKADFPADKVDYDFLIVQNNVGIAAGGTVQAMITWPCAFN